METRQRINLWSSPRNISTALLYSFAQRQDTTPIDEPLYAHYLSHQPTEAEHPGREEVLASQDNNGRRVVERILQYDFGTPAVVFKQMTHHLIDLPLDFLAEMTNVLLIRDPREILASFGKVVEKVTALDVGLPQQADLFDRLSEEGRIPVVVDARRLLEDPAGVLATLCARIDLEYSPAMLHWPAGPKPYDGVWAEHWYGGVHGSTGFLPYRERVVELSPALEHVADECTPIYQRLLSAAIP